MYLDEVFEAGTLHGKNEEITSEDVRKIFSKVVKKARELKIIRMKKFLEVIYEV